MGAAILLTSNSISNRSYLCLMSVRLNIKLFGNRRVVNEERERKPTMKNRKRQALAFVDDSVDLWQYSE